MLKFEISNEEHVAFKIKFEEHEKECKYFKTTEDGLPNMGAIGGALTYSFTPTTVGTVVTVTCACGHKMDVTDYDQW